jgi:hypothetical protein
MAVPADLLQIGALFAVGFQRRVPGLEGVGDEVLQLHLVDPMGKDCRNTG